MSSRRNGGLYRKAETVFENLGFSATSEKFRFKLFEFSDITAS